MHMLRCIQRYPFFRCNLLKRGNIYAILISHKMSQNENNCVFLTLRLSRILMNHFRPLNRGIKHDFPFFNICKVPRDVLKTEGEARGFQPSRGTLRMLMNDKIIVDRYYCINSANHCENEENMGALYFITSLHFPTRIRF